MNDLPPGVLRTPEGHYVLADDTHLSRWVEIHKTLEVAAGEIELFARFIPEGGSVVDAGASIGDHTATYARLVGPNGHVLAFEPNPQSFQCLRLNFKDRLNVACIEAALSDNDQRIAFTPMPNAGASHAFASRRNPHYDVRAMTLDRAVMESLSRLDFIHLDAEGYEIRILAGGQQAIAKFQPAIVLEVNEECLRRLGLSQDDVYAAVADLDYTWQEIIPGHGPHLPQRDILCLPS